MTSWLEYGVVGREAIPACDEPGCNRPVEVECYDPVPPGVPEDEIIPAAELCPIHARQRGYCLGCGERWEHQQGASGDYCPDCVDDPLLCGPAEARLWEDLP